MNMNKNYLKILHHKPLAYILNININEILIYLIELILPELPLPAHEQK